MAIKEQARGATPANPTPARARLRGWRLALAILAGVVVILLLAGAGFAVWTVRHSLATTSGTLKLPGLSAPVTVVRDANGIPHLTAATSADLFRAQGYVVAQDRLWQMDFYRRVGAGRLSEVLGDVTLDTDRFVRTVGWRRAAEQELTSVPAESLAALQAYADGVNAFLDSHQDALPLEFTILGYKPDHWTPVDTLTFSKVMAWDLADNLDLEITMADLQAKLGVQRAATLLPAYPDGKTTIVQQSALLGNPQGHAAAPIRRSGIFGALHGDTFVGSNNWVVDGTHSADGHPLLANDPHLGVQNPSIWYAMQLDAQDGSLNVAGVTFPGVPGIVVGHNRDITWGVTNLGPDTQDLFIETVGTLAHAGQYLYKGQWQPLTVLKENIPVKDSTPELLVVTSTVHGPLLDAVRDDLKQPAALEWTALQSGKIISALLHLDRAANWDQFHAALADWDSPGQNFVYADTAGNIGYQATGLWPVRKKGNGLAPVDGASGDYDWTGFVPYEQMPRVLNPPAHVLVTANNRVVGPDYPHLITGWWGPWFRAERITQMIAAHPKLSMDDVKAMQYDTHDLLAAAIGKHLAALPAADAGSRQAVSLFAGWDGDIRADSAPAALYEVTYQQILTNTFADDLGGSLAAEYFDTAGQAAAEILSQIVEDPTNAWWDDSRTPQQETRDTILSKSLLEATGVLSNSLGADMTKWSWGALHTITFGHTLGAVPPLDRLLNFGPFPNGGDTYTVDTGGFVEDPTQPYTYRQTNHPSMRMITDPGDWARTQLVFAPGESGQLADTHWGDQVAAWLHGDYRTLPWTPAQAAAGAEGTLTLQP